MALYWGDFDGNFDRDDRAIRERHMPRSNALKPGLPVGGAVLEHINKIRKDATLSESFEVGGGKEKVLFGLNHQDTLDSLNISLRNNGVLPSNRGYRLFIDAEPRPSVYSVPIANLVDDSKERIALKLGDFFEICNVTARKKK